jgi:hypothetical protein
MGGKGLWLQKLEFYETASAKGERSFATIFSFFDELHHDFYNRRYNRGSNLDPD